MPPKIQEHLAGFVCSVTGQSVATARPDKPVGLCDCCPGPGKPAVVRYDMQAVKRTLASTPLGQSAGEGLFRFAPLLPIADVPDGYGVGLGNTPTAAQPALSAEAACDVWTKDESVNPTGSFKDRGLAMAVALGAATGAKRFCLPTQGNAGVAAAFWSKRMGLPGAFVAMPDGYQDSIYHRSAAHFGAETMFSGDNIAATGKAMRERLRDGLASGDIVELSTFFEPGRLEGKKTMGLEIFETFGANTLPDAIVYPTGGGTGLAGIYKAFEELRTLGLLPPDVTLPRMYAVQSTQCAPVVASFDAEREHVEPVQSRGTVADGLDVPGAIMGHELLRVLRASGGGGVAVSEAEILDAFAFYGMHGVTGGYESAATFAALRRLRTDGRVGPGDRVLLLHTGHQLIALARGQN